MTFPRKKLPLAPGWEPPMKEDDSGVIKTDAIPVAVRTDRPAPGQGEQPRM